MASTELVTAVTREGKFNKNAARRVRVGDERGHQEFGINVDPLFLAAEIFCVVLEHAELELTFGHVANLRDSWCRREDCRDSRRRREARMSTAGPSQDANCAPWGGSAAADSASEAASVGVAP